MSKGENMVERGDHSGDVLKSLQRAVSRLPWVKHHGRGDPPRDTPDFVQVQFHDGDTAFGIRWDWDQNWSWTGDPEPGCIVAYRTLAYCRSYFEATPVKPLRAALNMGKSHNKAKKSTKPTT